VLGRLSASPPFYVVARKIFADIVVYGRVEIVLFLLQDKLSRLATVYTVARITAEKAFLDQFLCTYFLFVFEVHFFLSKLVIKVKLATEQFGL
jgi:hypothetical protein